MEYGKLYNRTEFGTMNSRYGISSDTLDAQEQRTYQKHSTMTPEYHREYYLFGTEAGEVYRVRGYRRSKSTRIIHRYQHIL